MGCEMRGLVRMCFSEVGDGISSLWEESHLWAMPCKAKCNGRVSDDKILRIIFQRPVWKTEAPIHRLH